MSSCLCSCAWLRAVTVSVVVCVLLSMSMCVCVCVAACDMRCGGVASVCFSRTSACELVVVGAKCQCGFGYRRCDVDIHVRPCEWGSRRYGWLDAFSLSPSLSVFLLVSLLLLPFCFVVYLFPILSLSISLAQETRFPSLPLPLPTFRVDALNVGM